MPPKTATACRLSTSTISEQLQAIMDAAEKTNSPVIIQASRGARKYTRDVFLKGLIKAAAEAYPNIPIVMHQDHGNSPSTCTSRSSNGFTSVMMDGSLEADGKTPADLRVQRRTSPGGVERPTRVGVSVEGELGCLGSLETGKGEKEDGHGVEGKLSKISC